MERRFFTLEEANTLLAYLSPLMELAYAKKAEIVKIVRGLEAAGIRVEELFKRDANADGDGQTSTQLRNLADEINSLLIEMQDTGCVVKDLETGLIDFWGRIGEEDIFLCWKLGESEVSHWHSPKEGFAQRKSLFTREILSEVAKLH